MQKMALIFVNGMENDVAKTIQVCSAAALGAYKKKASLFSKPEFETIVVQVIDIQSLLGIKYNVEKMGIAHFLATNNEANPDPRQTVLAVGPEDAEKLNRMSAGLRLF